MQGETFKIIDSYPGYRVSNYGRVINTRTDRIMSMTRNRLNGWYYVTLRKEGRSVSIPVQRLVADAFLKEPVDPNLSLLHRDGDRSNNSVQNLVWKPRWFVVMYMRQINFPTHNVPYRLIAEKTGETFETVAQFAYAAVTLPSDVIANLGVAWYPGYGRLQKV